MKIDIIIPSRRRPVFLKQCLAGLVRQSKRPARVLIIENDRQSVYRELVKEFSALNIKLYLEPRLGKASARNTGLRLAKGEIIAFLDDDCRVFPDWLENISRAYQRFPDTDVLLGGSLEEDKSLLMRVYTFQYQKFFFKIRVNFQTGRVRCGGALNSRNFSLKKAFLDRTGLRFDTRYDRFGFAEDTDFGEQLEKAGARIYYSPKIRVLHSEENNLIPLLLKKFRNGQAIQTLRAKGIFHDYRRQKITLMRKITIVSKKIKKVGFFDTLVFIFYFYLIVASYRAGIFYQKLYLFLKRVSLTLTRAPADR